MIETVRGKGSSPITELPARNTPLSDRRLTSVGGVDVKLYNTFTTLAVFRGILTNEGIRLRETDRAATLREKAL
jgi:hypothetical protein